MKNVYVHNFKIFSGHSIRTKFVFIISLIVFVISLFIYFDFPLRLEKQAIESIAYKAKSIADMAAYNISTALVFLDQREMESILKNVRQNKDLAYLVVLYDNGKLFKDWHYETAVKVNFKSFPADTPISDDGLYYRLRCSINANEKIIGHLFLGLSLEDLRDRVERSRKTTAIVSLIIIIFGVAAAFLISAVLTKPLNEMIGIIEQISHGDLSQRIHYHSRDELGKLASSFNLMIKNLENYSTELMRLNNNLENEVAERTEKLRIEINERWLAQEGKNKLEAQLRQAQKMESIGTLAGGIAHDFNNILSAVIGYTELTIRMVEEDSQVRSNLNKVFAASMRAKDLIKKILTFSRKTENERNPICLDEIVEEALNLMQSTLPATIDIVRDLPYMENFVIANKSEIHQIVMNLCSNAAHAMRENGGILTVELREVILEGDIISKKELTTGIYQRLTVSDTGCGMHPVILNRIFEPYFTTKKEGEGTGMGLSVVHGIIKSCGGDITVYSEPGKGTTFNVFLPIAKTGLKKTVLDSIETARGGNEQILLVDDEPAIAELEKSILVDIGYNVTSCSGSVEALEKFTAEPNRFNIVISDQTMPKMTGLQLVDRIRKINPGIPILLCSGFSDAVNEETYQSFGINAFLMKPIIKNDFARIVREVLDSNSQTRDI